jgi:hypothetical protein
MGREECWFEQPGVSKGDRSTVALAGSSWTGCPRLAPACRFLVDWMPQTGSGVGHAGLYTGVFVAVGCPGLAPGWLTLVST